ncbi:hypothetical protein BWO91_17560 [Plantibacter flavus]|uniref:DUF4190 domain-containing protein n=1 Tax=Plantibacter flavus TaxID=150123 RepID=UPI00099B35B0|nr:DUF4190 domain-containing protein [Plantibacter flavus]AQX81528.1 hypothetical protein BWO91_17560 [Plantibacter flavus]
MSTPDGSKPQPLAPQQAHSQQSVPPQPYPQQQLQPQQYGVQPYAQQAPYPPQYGMQPYAPVYPAPYPYPASPPKGLSISSMVIGLVSLFFGFTFVLPVVGFVLGLMGLRREPAGRAMAITGVVLNGLFLLVWAALVLLWVFVIGGLLAGVGGAASTGIAA